MENLATLIGTKNLQTLIADDNNTYVVIENDNGVLEYIKNTNDVNFGKVIGIGTFNDCASLVRFLNLTKLATN